MNAGNALSTLAPGESDEQVVPTKRSNNEEQSFEESVEGSCSTKGNIDEANTSRAQAREIVSRGLVGVREAARRDSNPARGLTPHTQGRSRMR